MSSIYQQHLSQISQSPGLPLSSSSLLVTPLDLLLRDGTPFIVSATKKGKNTIGFFWEKLFNENTGQITLFYYLGPAAAAAAPFSSSATVEGGSSFLS